MVIDRNYKFFLADRRLKSNGFSVWWLTLLGVGPIISPQLVRRGHAALQANLNDISVGIL